MNKKISLLIGMFLLCSMTAFAVVPTEDYAIEASVNLSSNPIQLNDSGLNGVIRIENNSNIVLDMNNSHMYGNGTVGSIGIRIEGGLSNINIRNMNNLTLYTYPIRINSATQPNFNAIDYRLKNITYSYSASTEILEISCKGTGTIDLSQMNNIDSGVNGYYDVFHDGTYVGSSNSDTYTLSSCSAWVFSPTTANRHTYTASESALFFIMAFLIIFGGLYWLINTGDLRALIPIILGCTLAASIIAPLL